MRITNINSIYTQQKFCSAQNIDNRLHQKKNSPIRTGLSTAGGWFAFGVGLDFASRKIQFSKSPTKNSIMINSILALGAGIYAGSTSKNKK